MRGAGLWNRLNNSAMPSGGGVSVESVERCGAALGGSGLCGLIRPLGGRSLRRLGSDSLRRRRREACGDGVDDL